MMGTLQILFWMLLFLHWNEEMCYQLKAGVKRTMLEAWEERRKHETAVKEQESTLGKKAQPDCPAAPQASCAQWDGHPRGTEGHLITLRLEFCQENRWKPKRNKGMESISMGVIMMIDSRMEARRRSEDRAKMERAKVWPRGEESLELSITGEGREVLEFEAFL